jgi:hypothetical protein
MPGIRSSIESCRVKKNLLVFFISTPFAIYPVAFVRFAVMLLQVPIAITV